MECTLVERNRVERPAWSGTYIKSSLGASTVVLMPILTASGAAGTSQVRRPAGVVHCGPNKLIGSAAGGGACIGGVCIGSAADGVDDGAADDGGCGGCGGCSGGGVPPYLWNATCSVATTDVIVWCSISVSKCSTVPLGMQ